MRSPYDVLGVASTASDSDVRKAFHRLAKRHHPDLNPGNPQAEAQFKEVKAAYDFLSDRPRRARFDRGEITADGHDTFAQTAAGERYASQASGGFRFSFGDMPDDFFSEVFSNTAWASSTTTARTSRRTRPGMAERGQDLRQSVTVAFQEAALGGVTRVALKGRALDVTLPPGLRDGQTLRLGGQGAPSSEGGLAGDLLLEVRVTPHPLFERDGNDLHLDLPVSLAQAVLGGKVMVPTLTGTVALSIPPRANTGTVLRLKGKGIQGGDQHVRLKVMLPEPMDPELEDFIRQWSRNQK